MALAPPLVAVDFTRLRRVDGSLVGSDKKITAVPSIGRVTKNTGTDRGFFDLPASVEATSGSTDLSGVLWLAATDQNDESWAWKISIEGEAGSRLVSVPAAGLGGRTKVVSSGSNPPPGTYPAAYLTALAPFTGPASGGSSGGSGGVDMTAVSTAIDQKLSTFLDDLKNNDRLTQYEIDLIEVPRSTADSTPANLLGKVTRFDTSSAAISQVLPPAQPGRTLAIGWDAGANPLTLTRDGTDVFGAGSATSITVQIPGTVLTLHCTTAGRWRVIADHIPTTGFDGRYMLKPDETGAAAGSVSALRKRSDGTGYDLVELINALPIVDDVTDFGDSLTESVGTNWPSALATALGVTATNAGKSGWASSDIALRQGGLDLACTVTGNQIPASGPVTVTAVSPATSFRSDSTGVTFSWVGTLAGVPGTLTRVVNGAAGTWSFTRTDPGAAVACPAGTKFHCTEFDTHRGRIQTLWVGRNNLTANGPVLSDVTRDLDLMLRRLTSHDRRGLVLGVTNASGETRNSANWTAITALNTALAARYGVRFLDIRAWLIANGLALAGITPTVQDTADIANDVIPSSLRVDTIHLTATGYGLVAALVGDKLRALGWVTGQLPAVAPGQVTGLAAGTATGTTQPMSWTALAGATAYTLEYRASGQTVWQLAGNTTGTSLTVTGLAQGTTYEYRVTARTVAGPGPVSATVTAATTGTPPVVLVSDSFNRADGALGSTDSAQGGTSKAWSSDGTVTVSGNRWTATNPGSWRTSTVDAAQADMHVKAVALRAATLTCAIVARHDGTNTYYALTISTAGNLQFSKVVAGSATALGSAINAGAAQSAVIGLRLSTVGGNAVLEATVNGVVVGTYTDSTSPLLAATRGGIRSAFSETTQFDDFAISDK